MTERSPFDFMGKKPLWFGISAVLLLPGLVAIVLSCLTFGSPVKLGIDFTGGSLIQLGFRAPVKAAEVQHVLAAAGHDGAQVQIADGRVALIRTRALSSAEREGLLGSIRQRLGAFTPERFESVGPTIGKELLTHSLAALAITLLAIVGYISYRYQFDFAVCAILALVHDVLFVVGVFAILGLTIGVEVDSLFVTALLTVIGFCVHDTIIIFDRIRENMRLAGKRDTFDDVANRSIHQTLARSINTSLTVALTLVSLLVFGGESLRWFVFAMLIGIVNGAYGSIFNASQLLSAWRMLGVRASAAPASAAKGS